MVQEKHLRFIQFLKNDIHSLGWIWTLSFTVRRISIRLLRGRNLSRTLVAFVFFYIFFEILIYFLSHSDIPMIILDFLNRSRSLFSNKIITFSWFSSFNIKAISFWLSFYNLSSDKSNDKIHRIWKVQIIFHAFLIYKNFIFSCRT